MRQQFRDGLILFSLILLGPASRAEENCTDCAAATRPAANAPGARTSDLQKAAQAATGLIRAGEKEALFRLKDKDGKTPTITLLNHSVFEHSIAYTLTQGAIKMESDPERKKLMTADTKIEMRFEGLVFKKDEKNPERVQVILVGRTQEVPLPQKLSIADVESGKSISLRMPAATRSVLGYEVSGSGVLKIRYLKESDRLEVPEASGDIQVEIPLKGPISDQGSTSGTGERDAKLTRRPLQKL